MSARSITARVFAAISVAIAAIGAVTVLIGIGVIPRTVAPELVYGVIVALVGIWLVRALGGLTVKLLQPKVGPRSIAVRNILSVLGYAVVIIAALSVSGVNPSVALAGGTVAGLVVGLGAQLVISNFFSGLVILATGFVRVGDDVRLINPSLPFQPAGAQPYKYFSPDYINVGYRGTILDVGLTYTLMRTDTGLGLKIPNQVLLNSGILEYRPAGSGQRSLQVRYEFKIDYDPQLVLSQVKAKLADLKQVGDIVINEQSDKEYYILLIQFSVPPEEDWSALKSEILSRLIMIQRELRQTA